MTPDTLRCPDCGAVCWPRWLITHRPGCPYDGLDSAQWPELHQEGSR